MKNWKKYIMYAIFIFSILICLSFSSNKINMYQNATAGINLYILWLIMFLANTIFGFVLGIESLLKEKGKKGMWAFNIPRIIILGLPSLIMGSYFFIYYMDIQIILTLTEYLPKFMIKSSMFVTFNQILFGYILVTNITKGRNSIKEGKIE